MTLEQKEPKLAAERSLSLADEFIDSWVCWREACEDVSSAYEHWATCNAPQSPFAFEGYRAALDREEQAARVHSVWAERLQAAAAPNLRCVGRAGSSADERDHA